MSLEVKLKAWQIVRQAGMSERPEYYSGRGATSSDVNDKILEKTYQIVQREHGKEAAGEFAQMVADIPVLSATDFLLTFYRLEGNKWKWHKGLLGNEKGMDFGSDHDDGARWAIGVATIGNVFGGSHDRDDTRHIRGESLARHGIEQPQKIYFSNR